MNDAKPDDGCDAETTRQVTARAHCDQRSWWRYRRGLSVRPSTAARIERALSELSLHHLSHATQVAAPVVDRAPRPPRVLALRTCVIPTCRIRISVEGHGALCTIRRGEWRSTGLCKFCAAYYWVCCECDSIFPRSALSSTDDESGVHYRCAACLKSGKADCNQLPRNQPANAPRA